MVEALHVMFLETTKITFVIANYIVINVDEVTTIDNIQWLLIHLYVVQKWKKILMFLYVETISQYAIFNNIFSLMLKCIINFWGLRLEELGKQLVIVVIVVVFPKAIKQVLLCNLKKLLYIFTMLEMSFYD
jgi:hypothetical protein